MTSADVPVIAFVGKSNSGKTTLIESCIRELRGRGYRVGTVKHIREGTPVDVVGKDSWRHAQAGATDVVLHGGNQVALFRSFHESPSIRELQDMIRDVDVILVEGGTDKCDARIEVSHSDCSRGLLNPPSQQFAPVFDYCIDGRMFDSPIFGLDDHMGLVEVIESTFLRPRG
jgi:molybdopterin-guanine dinucleotide biosynthesis protein MobB